MATTVAMWLLSFMLFLQHVTSSHLRRSDGHIVKQAEQEASWIQCAGQYEVCQCPGKVKWGNKDTWKIIDAKKDGSMNEVTCSFEKLGDPLPGDDNKHCECQVTPGTEFFSSLNVMLLAGSAAEERGAKLVASCDIFEAAKDRSKADAAQWSAVEPFCSDAWEKNAEKDPLLKTGPKKIELPRLRELMSARVDARFEKNYDKEVKKDGWIPRAFVNYYKGPTDGKHAKMTEELIRSVHLFSSAPIVVFHFGQLTPPSWNAERFPRLVLIHALPISSHESRSFNFNKFRSALLCRVKTAVELDSDQFVGPGVDDMFSMTDREITKDYPYPIMPVHFYSFTKKDTPNSVWWKRYCADGDCSRHSMRWGHAHPTWTYWALPFFGRWLRRNFRDETLPPLDGKTEATSIRITNIGEDEDLLNVATWEEKLTKQWCKYDNCRTEFTDILSWKPSMGSKCPSGVGCMDIYEDVKFYPKGAAKAFYTAHDAKNPAESRRIIDEMYKHYKAGTYPNSTIVYRGQFVNSAADLKSEYPDLKCIF